MFKVGDKVCINPNDDARLRIEKDNPEFLRDGYAVVQRMFKRGTISFGEYRGSWYEWRFSLYKGKRMKTNYRKWAKDNKVYNYSRLPLATLKESYPDASKLPEKPSKSWFEHPLSFLDNWVVVDRQGGRHSYLGEACLWNMKKIQKPSRFVYGISLGNHPRYEEWIDYHINRSPFAHVFKTKDAKKAITHGLELDVEANFSHCVAAMTCVRQGWEHTSIVDGFFHLLKLGAKENTALVFSHCVHKNNRNYTVYVKSAHTAFCDGMLVGDLANFANKGCLLTPRKGRLKDGGQPYAVNLSISEIDHYSEKRISKWLPGHKEDGWDSEKICNEGNLIKAIKEFESL
jgi:hypothetical protein